MFVKPGSPSRAPAAAGQPPVKNAPMKTAAQDAAAPQRPGGLTGPGPVAFARRRRRRGQGHVMAVGEREAQRDHRRGHDEAR
jgi:hypothetical protein